MFFSYFFFFSEEIYPTYFAKSWGSLKIKTQCKRRHLRITLLLKKAKEIDSFRHLSWADSNTWILNLVLTYLTAKPKREAYWVAEIVVFLTIDSIHMHLWRQKCFLELNLGRNSSCRSLDKGHEIIRRNLLSSFASWRAAIKVAFFPGGSDDKESTCNVGDLGSSPGLERSPGGGHDNPLQYSCLENPTDRGTRRAAVHGVVKSRTQLSN